MIQGKEKDIYEVLTDADLEYLQEFSLLWSLRNGTTTLAKIKERAKEFKRRAKECETFCEQFKDWKPHTNEFIEEVLLFKTADGINTLAELKKGIEGYKKNARDYESFCEKFKDWQPGKEMSAEQQLNELFDFKC